MAISVGNRVRSFDFAESFDDGAQFGRDLTGERACFVEGVVVGIESHGGCDRYIIDVDRDVFGGEESTRRLAQRVMPPVNGTPTWSGRTTNFVELV